jgi:competence protein ComEA
MDLGKFNKFRWVDGLLILGILLVIVGIGMNFKDQFLEKAEVKFINKSVGLTEVVDVQSNNEVVIDISGEVINPGVYRLIGDVRINDALIKAGGLKANADRDWVAKNLNLAERLMDGQKIYIPNEVESDGILGVSVNNKIVRINSTTIEQLDTLSGIGPSIAKKIIDYRTANGGFKNIEELKLVSGIGDKLYEEIKNDVAL